MAIQVSAGATLACSFGTAPSPLTVTPLGPPVLAAGAGAATIEHHAPTVNIAPFAMCTTPTNPQVAAANSPQPCIPMTTMPWVPGSPTVLINGKPALGSTSRCQCQWGGDISIVTPGPSTTVTVA